MAFKVNDVEITSILNAGFKTGRDSENLIDFATTDNKLIFRVNNVNEVEIVENVLQPTTSDGVALGTGSLMWSDLFLADGSVINFNNGDITLTHTSNTLTVAGGTLAAAAITGTTIDASTDFTVGGTTITDGALADGSFTINSDLFVANAKGLVIGHTAQVSAYGAAWESQVLGTANADSGLLIARFSDTASGGQLLLGSSRGTSIDSHTIVQDGDTLGRIVFAGSDGGDMVPVGAMITGAVDGTPGANDMPGRLIFGTTADGAQDVTERLRIDSTGAIGIAGANYGTDGQVLTSGGAGAAVAWEDASGGGGLDDLSFINESANGSMTVGLTINQGAADDQILAFKSSDIGHGMTGLTETDTYAFFKKTNGTDGGLEIETIAEGTNVIATIVVGTAIAQNTTKSTSGRALHEIRGYDTLSTSRQAIGTGTTDSNILGVYDGTTQRWVADSSGNTWQSGVLNIGIGTDVDTANAYSALVIEKDDHSRLEFLNPVDKVGTIWFSDTTEGMGRIEYSHSNNQFDIRTNATYALTIDSSQDVGIGISTPDSRLHLWDGTAGTIAAASNTVLTVENSANAIIQILTPAANVGSIYFGSPTSNERGVFQYNHNTDFMHWNVAASTRMSLDSTGTLYIGDTANTNMTQGLTLNQGAADNQILVARSSDVKHVLTSLPTSAIIAGQAVFTDDFFTVGKVSAANGGVTMQFLAKAAIAAPANFIAFGGSGDNTKSTSGVGAYNFFASSHDGANGFVNMAANANLMAVSGRVGGANVTRWILDAEGDTWQTGSMTLGGGQIAFPATQNASSDANTLDDYEEGTWTATFNGMSITYAANTGRYTKVGNLVTAYVYINIGSQTTGTSATYVEGLPFVNHASGPYASVCFGQLYQFNVAVGTPGDVVGQVAGNTANIGLYSSVTDGNWVQINGGSLDNTNVGVMISVTYVTNT